MANSCQYSIALFTANNFHLIYASDYMQCIPITNYLIQFSFSKTLIKNEINSSFPKGSMTLNSVATRGVWCGRNAAVGGGGPQKLWDGTCAAVDPTPISPAT
jgi:hypothetical protein